MYFIYIYIYNNNIFLCVCVFYGSFFALFLCFFGLIFFLISYIVYYKCDCSCSCLAFSPVLGGFITSAGFTKLLLEFSIYAVVTIINPRCACAQRGL